MAVYVRFEDLPIWKLPKDLAVNIYQINVGTALVAVRLKFRTGTSPVPT